MPNDRSESALRERLEIAEKAAQGPWMAVHDVNGDILPFLEGPYGWIFGGGFDDDGLAYVNPSFEDLEHIAASSPDVVREDIEEILQLRKERDWLLREIVNTSDRQFCPMPDRYECLYHVGHECKSREVEMRVGCWRTAVECAVKYEEEKNNVE